MNKVLESGGERGILSGMNTYDYAIQHAEAIAPAGFGVDSASNEAVTAQMLANYPAVVWILGQEKGETEALSPAERDLIASYLSQGGSLFISGSELAEELATVEGGQAFLQETLHATFVKGDAGARKAITNSDSLLGSTHELSLEGTYFAMTPDVIAPTGDADVLMSYPEGAAAVQYAGDDYKVVYLAFPFEAIQDPAARREVMARSLEFLTGQSRRTAMK
jgi:hypothetical protein